MNLFQQLLVAGAAARVLAPLASQATEVNIDDMNSYSSSKSSKIKFDSNSFSNEDFAVLKGRVDGLEAQQNNFEAGSFSDTTTLDGKAVFSVGAIDWSDATKLDEVDGLLSDAVLFQYMYQMNLNTSFTGDDNLYVRLKTGNNPSATGAEKAFGDKRYGTYLSATNTKSDALTVDKMWYTMPVGDKTTVFIGPKVENYYMHGTTPVSYTHLTLPTKRIV